MTDWKKLAVLAGLLSLSMLLPLPIAAQGSLTAPGSPAVSGPLPALSPSLQQQLDRFMTDTLNSSDAPGMILGIWLPSRGEFVRAAGLADLATREPMRVGDTFRMGSVTKTFTSTVVLQLVDAGTLRLDDPINKFTRASVPTSLIPAIPNGDKITIRMLLMHTSGLYNYSEIPRIERLITLRFLDLPPRRLVAAAIHVKPYFAPGAGFMYSNTNTIILGMLIEQLTGNTLSAEITRRFIDPLHLTHTTFPTTETTIPGHFSHGYLQTTPKSKLQEWTRMNTSWAWAAGGMTSDLYDLRTWVTSLTSEGLLSTALQADRMSEWAPYPLTPLLPGLKYGKNLFTVAGFVGHNGGLPGFVCMAMRNPQSGDTIVFMLNAQTPTDITIKIFVQLLPVLYPGIVVK